MIEDAVLIELRSFLDDRLRLTKALHLTGASMKEILAEARCLGDRFQKDGPAEQRAFLLEVVKSVEVQQNRVSIILRPQVLHAMLSRGRFDHDKVKTVAHDEEEIRLEIPVKFKRRGVEMKLVITDNQKRLPNPDHHLIAAVAQGRHWFAQIKDGDVKSVRELAADQGVNQGDVSRILPLGLLAPDIVEAILYGRQPTELTASRLKRIGDLPISWAEQRCILGFV